MIFAAEMPIRQAYLNDMIPSRQRATVLSFDSLMGSSGGVVIQPVLGKAADVYSYSTSLVIGAAIQLVSVAVPRAQPPRELAGRRGDGAHARRGPAGLEAAAVDVDDLAGDVARVVRAEERDHVRDVRRLADPLEGGALRGHLLEVLEVDAEPLRGLLRHRRRDEARARRS